MPSRLDIYIEGGCKNCLTSVTIAEQVKEQMPAVQVNVIDLVQEPNRRREQIFAVPTFILNGEILSLGNPRLEDLLAALRNKTKS